MNKTISLSQAFAHFAGTGSYWLWIAIALVFAVALVIWMIKSDFGDGGNIAAIVVIAFLLAVAVCYRPFEVKENTSQEQAARGVYLGY